MKNVLGIFVKHPEPGAVKTRLCPDLDRDQAARIYRAMAEDVVFRHARSDSHDTLVFFTPAEARAEIRRWLGPEVGLMSQTGDDLGARQLNAFRDAPRLGYDRVTIIGSDCVEIGSTDIGSAFDALGQHDLVIGPSEDGGYYLIGATRAHAGIFENIPWGGADVLSRLLERADAAGLSYQLLDKKHDVDTYEDLIRLRGRLGGAGHEAAGSRTAHILESILTGGA
jgi:rSAM/selenodomain-associated transferase 1